MDDNGVLCWMFQLPFLETCQRHVHLPGALASAHHHLANLADTPHTDPHRCPYTEVCPSFPSHYLNCSSFYNLTMDYFEIFAEYLLCATVWPVLLVFTFSTPLPRPLWAPRISTAAALARGMDDCSIATPPLRDLPGLSAVMMW